MSTAVSLLTWNINGIADKLGDPDIHTLIKKYDVIALLETMKDKHYEIDIPGFINWHFARESRHKNAKRASGDFLVLVKQHINKYISVEQTNQYVVWLSFKSHPIIHIGFVYIPPIGTTSTRDTCPFDDLQDEIVSKRCTGQVYISGDFNSRTAEIRDIDMYRDFPGNMLLCKHRLNNDKVTKTYGRKLIDLCRSNEMAILNGTVRIDGNLNRSNCYTCIRYNGSSVVDYVIAQIEDLKIMTHFEVLEKLVESDHTPLSLTLEVVLDKPRTEQRRGRDVPYYYKWNPGNKQAFLEAFNATVTQNFYQEILCAVADGKTKSDGIIDLFYDMILTGIQDNFRKIGNNFKKDFPRNHWFYDECKQLKSLLKSNELGPEDRSQLQRQYKSAVQRKNETITKN